MDSMKQRSRRGFDTVREQVPRVLPRRPNIRLKVPKALPTRSLFQHEPRTWFGSKKEKGDKVKEDWRNQRPSTGDSASKKEMRGREDYQRRPSADPESPVRRSRSATRGVTHHTDDGHEKDGRGREDYLRRPSLTPDCPARRSRSATRRATHHTDDEYY